MTVEEYLGKDNLLGIDILKKKYIYQNETFDEWVDRVSGGNKELKKLIVEKKFLFGGRILANRGLQNKGRKITFSNCYVIEPPDDNIESIFDCAKKLARTYSYGGGCGIDVSKLAPTGAKVNNAAKETTGSISFMELYNMTTSLIGQNGRRGALMISMDISHPDVVEFIKLKSDLNKITKANLSVRISNDFMKAVENNSDWELNFTRPETNDIVVKTIKARELFNILAEMNWDYGEAGALFWDRISNWNLLSEDKNFKYAGVNPCAEEPLPAGGSCLLGSINFSEFVNNPFSENSNFNFPEFEYAVEQGVIALNEVLHEGLSLHPLKEQRKSVNDWRQIGLGGFGWHDCLIKLGIKYGSELSINLANDIGSVMINKAVETSAKITEKYGCYPKFNKKSIFKSEFFNKNINDKVKELVNAKGLANSQLLTIPPTGSIATMLGVSTALEPIYNISYTRKTESLHGEDKSYKVYTPIVEKYMNSNGIFEESELPNYFNTAMTINYIDRINMQSAWQKYIDASISSTVNVKENFTIKETEDLYLYAWKSGLKGVTLFRDNCKRVGILTNTKKENPTKEHFDTVLPRGYIEEVPTDLQYRKYKLKSGCGSLYLFVGVDEGDGKIYDVFTNTDQTGGCTVNTQANSRLLSAALRGGVPMEYIIEQLNKSGTCPSFSYKRGKGEKLCNGKSCPSAIANVLKSIHDEIETDMYEEVEIEENLINPNKYLNELQSCPECGEKTLAFEGGCNSCKSCGFSKCD